MLIKVTEAPQIMHCQECGFVIAASNLNVGQKFPTSWLYHHVNEKCSQHDKIFRMPVKTALLDAI